MKTQFKLEATVLRRRGNSYAEISEKISVSKSTASLWTSGVLVSDYGRERIKSKALQSQKNGTRVLRRKKLERITKAEALADSLVKEFPRGYSADFAIASVMYACEGSKEDRTIRFTNSDPGLVCLFLKTFRSSYAVDESKFRVRIHLHDYHDENELLNFWSSVTNISTHQFSKPFKKPSKHLYKKDGYKGCVHITYHDAHAARALIAFAKKLVKLYI